MAGIALAFVGVFVTMLTLLKLDKSLEDTGADFASTGTKFGFDGSWYASTLCIVFALTPAPVGQPRQIVLAHVWNIVVGLVCRQIPDGDLGDFMEVSGAGPGGMPLIWKQSLAVALGVSGQARLGILHPPATALSYAFAASQDWRWSTIGLVMLADFIVVIMSMMILNLSEKQQYPLFWLGIGWPATGGSQGYLRRYFNSRPQANEQHLPTIDDSGQALRQRRQRVYSRRAMMGSMGSWTQRGQPREVA